MRDYVLGQAESQAFLEKVDDLLTSGLPAFPAKGSRTSPSPWAAPAAGTAR